MITEQQTDKNSQNEYEKIMFIMNIIFGLNKENICQKAKQIFEGFDDTYPISFNTLVSQITYLLFVIKIIDIETFLGFIKEIEALEERNKCKSSIFNALTSFLIKKDTQESRFILYNMIKHNFIESKNIPKAPYFAQYMSEKEIISLRKDIYLRQLIENCEELSQNDWELHKQLIKEGVNPNEIAKIIRNDEIEKLQEISSQTNFDFNQTIEPSLYERHSFINHWNVSLIDYAAFLDQLNVLNIYL